MTEKAKGVLDNLRKRQAQTSDRALDEFNRSTLDDVGPVGKEQGTKLLGELNSLVDDHEEFVKSMMPRCDIKLNSDQPTNSPSATSWVPVALYSPNLLIASTSRSSTGRACLTVTKTYLRPCGSST